MCRHFADQLHQSKDTDLFTQPLRVHDKRLLCLDCSAMHLGNILKGLDVSSIEGVQHIHQPLCSRTLKTLQNRMEEKLTKLILFLTTKSCESQIISQCVSLR